MDQERFDTLTRVLGAGISRRQTLTVLGAALAGSGLRAVLPAQVAALSKKQRRRCKQKGGSVCSAGTKRSQCCATKNGPDDPGTCVHGACSCDPTSTFSVDNGCPVDANAEPGERCGCHSNPGGPGGVCADRNSACSETVCTTDADCDLGSVCFPGCAQGSEDGRCSTPCTPA